MLKSKQRATLRSFANNLPDIVSVGQNGVTDNVITQVNDNLYAHELIKIKVQKGSDIDAKEVANIIAEKTESEVVGVIGSKIILYKHSKKEGKHYRDLI